MKESVKPEQEDFPNWPEILPDLEQLIDCVKREIKYRRKVYARKIAMKTMSKEFAAWQIKLMECVLKNLERQRIEY